LKETAELDTLTAKVLLVEDSPTDAQLIQYGLRQSRMARYEVMVAERFDAAMAKLRELKFDVVLLDLGLPDSTGLATFTRVQTEFPGLPIVIMTGAGDETTGAEAIRGGAQDYLIKGSADAKSVASAIRYAIERKQTEEKLRELNLSLEQRVAERTAEVQRLADQLRALAADLSRTEQRERKRLAAILHDHIQQLLVAARMQVAWMKRDGNPERLHATAQGVDGILKEALDASRSLTVELSPPVLHETGLIGGLNWLASRTLEKNQFTVRLRADNKAEPTTEDTKFLLFECARELLLNVVKHAGVSEAQVTLMRTRHDRIKLIVRDEGKGFDPDLLKKRRADEVSFGLFSIQQRMAHIGGEIEIATAPGKGTSITLTVPVGKAQPHVSETDETLRKEEKTGKVIMREKRTAHRVLIVDDHKIMREGLVGLLQFEPDIEIVGQAADGPQAIELAEKLEPDIIIMDVNLGEMSGVEATKRILTSNPNIKVIGLSMHTSNDVATAMRDAGAVAYLTKGGPSEDLIAALRLHAPGAP
jgi:DNA-binding NarL/FixJ family response regulator